MYTYDQGIHNGNLAAKTYADGAVLFYTYDSNGNLGSYHPAVGNALTLSYDSLYRLSSVTGGPYSKNYSYRSLGGDRSTLNVSSISYSFGNGNAAFSYTYDSNGNISSEDISSEDPDLPGGSHRL